MTVFSMPRQIYDFVPINKMESFTIEERGRRIVDVCGIIKSADTETTTLTSKTTGKDMYKVCFRFQTSIEINKFISERTNHCG